MTILQTLEAIALHIIAGPVPVLIFGLLIAAAYVTITSAPTRSR